MDGTITLPIYDKLAVDYDKTTKQIVAPTTTLAIGDY
ncbi:hypothetical protein AX25_12585 [Listeria ivanovii WSLC3009]|nr:hypothetical protein AX25_12585 [Listeria ivanovii WSLC3009]